MRKILLGTIVCLLSLPYFVFPKTFSILTVTEQNYLITASLQTEISTKNNFVGEEVTAVIKRPSQFEGGTLFGEIVKCEPAKRGHRDSKLILIFHEMQINGDRKQFFGQLTAISNEKGKRLEIVGDEGEIKVKHRSRIIRWPWNFLTFWAKGDDIKLGKNTHLEVECSGGK